MKCNINLNFADRHYERSNGAETGNATVQLARTLASVILKHFIIYKNSPFHFALFFNAIFRCVFSPACCNVGFYEAGCYNNKRDKRKFYQACFYKLTQYVHVPAALNAHLWAGKDILGLLQEYRVQRVVEKGRQALKGRRERKGTLWRGEWGSVF